MHALLLATLLAANAHADTSVVQTLQLDLDGDAKPDVAQLLDTGADHYTLSIALTKSGKTLTYDKLIPKHKGETCDDRGTSTLKAGPASTLVWYLGVNDNDDDFGDCRYQEKNSYRFRLVGDELVLARADLYSQSWSMGSTAPHVTEVIDFDAHTIDLHLTEHHEFNVDRKAHEKLRANCSASARDLEAIGSALPMCAAQQAHYMLLELFPEDSENPVGTPVCPDLDGAYVCKWVSDNNTFNEQVLVIHRVNGKVHQYDASNDKMLIADGKTRLIDKDQSSRKYQTTTCRRETIKSNKTDWLILDKSDKRKPVYDKNPFNKEEVIWTQLDLEGKHFAYSDSEQYLNDDGTYRTAKPTIMDCVKQLVAP